MKRKSSKKTICNEAQIHQNFSELFKECANEKFMSNKLLSHNYKDKIGNDIKNYFIKLATDIHNTKKLFIFYSEPFVGVDFLVDFIIKNFNTTILSDIMGSEKNAARFLDCLTRRLPNQDTFLECKNFLYVIKNFPFNSLYDLLKNKRSVDIHNQFEMFKKRILSFLNSPQTSIYLLFYWEDGSAGDFAFEKMMEDSIINNIHTQRINFYKSSTSRMKNLIKDFTATIGLKFSETEIDLMIDKFDGNLKKMENFMYMSYIQKGFSTSNNSHMGKTCSPLHLDLSSQRNKNSVKNNKFSNETNIEKLSGEKIFSPFHIIGKFLHNKRIDPQTKEIKPMTKAEMNRKPRPQLYFKHQDLIDSLTISQEEFNLILIENSFDHFKDLGEIASATETFSLTDALDKFQYKCREKYLHESESLLNLRSLINSMACTCLNTCQYEGEEVKMSFKAYRKPIYCAKRSKGVDDELYFKSLRANRSIANLSKKSYNLEIKPILEILQRRGKKKPALDAINSNTTNTYYYRPDEEGKCICELKENLNNNNNEFDLSSFTGKDTQCACDDTNKNKKHIQFNYKPEITLDNLHENLDQFLCYFQNENSEDATKEYDEEDIFSD